MDDGRDLVDVIRAANARRDHALSELAAAMRVAARYSHAFRDGGSAQAREILRAATAADQAIARLIRAIAPAPVAEELISYRDQDRGDA